MSELTRCF